MLRTPPLAKWLAVAAMSIPTCSLAAVDTAEPAVESAPPIDTPDEVAGEGLLNQPEINDPAAEPPAAEAAAPELPSTIEPTDWVVLPRVGDYRRAAFHADPVEVRFARDPEQAPKVGDSVRAFDGRTANWRWPGETRGADLAGGYAFTQFDSPAAGVMLLEAPGAAAVWLNGVWLPGDPYGLGRLRVPTPVLAGRNRMLVHLARPDAAPRLVASPAPIAVIAAEATVPDLVIGSETDGAMASVPIVNASESPLDGLRLRVAWDEGNDSVTTLRRIDPLLVSPIAFTLPPISPMTAGALSLRVEVLASEGDEPLATGELTVRVVAAAAARRVTRKSAIDGSVQPYAAAPPSGDRQGVAGVVLLLHDAGQTAEDTIASFAAPDGYWVVAPHGRGRWGFDWEDWSREDALEALDHFLQQREASGEPIDADRIAIAGAGMGGHGALRIATLHPDRFASAVMTDAWLAFGSPKRVRPDGERTRALREVLTRQAEATNPLRVLENLAGVAVAVAQRGTPEADSADCRRLRAKLAEFHTDFAYRETAEEGNGLAAWLKRGRSAANKPANRVTFATPDLGAASSRGWVTLVAAERSGEVARFELRRNPDEVGAIRGNTTNVKRLKIDFASLPKPDTGMYRVRLDGGDTVRFRPGRTGETLDLIRDADGQWRRVPRGLSVARPFGPALKTPERGGGIKSAFGNRPLLVYGTTGSDEENRWAAARARYDAHLFLYRGGGRLEVLPDSAAGAQLATDAGRDRSVVLYGNADTNLAFRLLARDGALRVASGAVTLANRPESGDELALVAVRPRIASTKATVAVVGGTGPVGMRLTDRLRWFWAGAPYPDVLVFGPEALAPPEGQAAEDDVRAAGWFGYDWKVGEGVVWRDAAI